MSLPGPRIAILLAVLFMTVACPLTPRVEAPVISPGTMADLDDDAFVTISCATAGADIYYTTDGSVPGASNPAAVLYTAPLPGAGFPPGAAVNVTIRAIAVKGDTKSAVSEAVYSNVVNNTEWYRTLPVGSRYDLADFDGRHAYSLVTALPASKPQANAPAGTTFQYSVDTTFIGTPVTDNNLIAGVLNRADAEWYYFNAIGGETYTIGWDDSQDGSGVYTCDIAVSAYRQSRTIAYLMAVNDGYGPNARTITAAATERIYILVSGRTVSQSGTYGLQVTGTLGPVGALTPEAGTDVAASGPSKNRTGKTALDAALRAQENDLLASRRPLVEKSRSGVRAAPAAPISVDDHWTGVSVINYINDDTGVVTYATINTTCRRAGVGDYAFFFIDDRDVAAMEPRLDSYVAAFNAIAPVNRARFGTENDVDGNGRVIIVFSRELEKVSDLLGYFNSIDKFPGSHSNQGDIFYMTTDPDWQGPVINGTLAHEYQHMIYFDEHYDRGVRSTYTWLNEALSQAAEYYSGYTADHVAWITDFLEGGYSHLSLTHWTSDNYGFGAVFIRYLIDRFGDTPIRNMCATNLTGIAAVEAATGMDFNQLFDDFSRALVLSGTGDATDPRYAFTTIDLRALQTSHRGGLLPAVYRPAGSSYSSDGTAYEIIFTCWLADFGTFSLSGPSAMKGTVFGLTY